MRLLTIFFLLMRIICSAQNENSQKQDIDSKCFSKCNLATDFVSDKDYKIALFTGTNPEGIDLDTVEFMGLPSLKWVKKGVDRNCVSNDPEDCLIWCLIEVPIQVDTIYLLRDIKQTNQFYLRDLNDYFEINKSEIVLWIQSICPEKVNQKFINSLAKSLTKKGYAPLNWKENDPFTPELMDVLIQFQKDKKLPIGEFDIKTLRKLKLPIDGF
jgi:hypothetical protein